MWYHKKVGTIICLSFMQTIRAQGSVIVFTFFQSFSILPTKNTLLYFPNLACQTLAPILAAWINGMKPRVEWLCISSTLSLHVIDSWCWISTQPVIFWICWHQTVVVRCQQLRDRAWTHFSRFFKPDVNKQTYTCILKTHASWMLSFIHWGQHAFKRIMLLTTVSP